MTSLVLKKSFKATAAAIAGFLIAKHSAANGTIEVASSSTDPLIGAVDSLGVEASGLADFNLAGMAPVRLGGAVAAGDPLTSDANAKAIKALPANSTQVRIIGFALAAGVADDIIDYHIAPGCLSKASA
ncbi:hypothetical protein [Devosia sp.]|uniref:hypothetical protein n=1 Tax=Devosia sp. TaxID=1871048 RepID=UPI001AC3CF95|nr:hypothetical protein [Devosia sp.]MBN9334708.1 hypothetical protein [Devosia sp.]